MKGEHMMRRFSILTFVMAIFLLAMGTSVAVAQGVHFTHGGEPACTITISTPTTGPRADADCDAELAGLGGGDIDLKLTLKGTAVYQCQNSGGNIAPGQNTVLIGPAVSDAVVLAGAVKNGRAELEDSTTGTGGVPLTAPPTATAQQAGCPNNNWTGVNPKLSVTFIEFSAVQNGVNLFDCTKQGTSLSGPITFADADCSGEARF
jgi:hypothetical protein